MEEIRPVNQYGKLRFDELPGDRRSKPINCFLLYTQLIIKSIE
jgi:hypothetical protein